MTDASHNDPIWSYFQNEAPHVFGSGHAHPRLEFLIRQIERLARTPRSSLLNIGIGDGHLEKSAHERGWSVSALDPSLESVSRLCALGVSAKVGRIEDIPFPETEFDFVIASEIFEHLTADQRKQGLTEIRRVLKPRAYLLGTVPYRELLADNLAICPRCKEVFHRWGHAVSFDIPTIRQELSAHFDDVRCRKTAFVEFKRRSLRGKMKGLARLLLAKCGAAIAVPNIYFLARKL
jgi:SAM-dependent methyltransferase